MRPPLGVDWRFFSFFTSLSPVSHGSVRGMAVGKMCFGQIIRSVPSRWGICDIAVGDSEGVVTVMAIS